MIVEAEVMVDDGVVGVIRFEKVLQRPSSLLRRCLHVVDLNGRQINAGVIPTISIPKWNLE